MSRSRSSASLGRVTAFVLAVLASVAGCGSSGREADEPAHRGPPLVLDQEGRPVGGAANEAAADAGVLEVVPDGGAGHVVEREDGSCWYVVERECAPKQPCNPPAPRRVRCPR